MNKYAKLYVDSLNEKLARRGGGAGAARARNEYNRLTANPPQDPSSYVGKGRGNTSVHNQRRFDRLNQLESRFGKEPPHHKGNTMDKSVVGAGVAPATPAATPAFTGLNLQNQGALDDYNQRQTNSATQQTAKNLGLQNADLMGQSSTPAAPSVLQSSAPAAAQSPSFSGINPPSIISPQQQTAQAGPSDDFLRSVMGVKGDLNLANSSLNRRKADHIRQNYRPGMKETDFYSDKGYTSIV